MLKQKIQNQSQLLRTLARLKKQGKRIVTVNGSFDLFHAGHLVAINEARRHGDILVALVNSDASVAAYKGPGRPIVPEAERAGLVAALEAVHYVSLFDEITPKRILGLIQPSVHCKGKDWGKNCIEREVVERYHGRIHLLHDRTPVSTTDLLRRMHGNSYPSPARAIFLDRDGTINVLNKDGYVFRKEDFHFLPGVIPALQGLMETNFKIIVITNQAGIGHKMYAHRDTQHLHRWMQRTLKKSGVRIDRIYYCPHRSDQGCTCRKPKIGMLLEAVRDFGVSLDKSWFIGDDPRDVLMGREANVKTVKINGRVPRGFPVTPHLYADDLKGAVRLILAREKEKLV